MRNAGLGQLQKQSRCESERRSISPRSNKESAIRVPIGNPHRTPGIKAPAPAGDMPNRKRKALPASFAIKEVAPKDTNSSESTINGKSEGISEYMQISIDFAIEAVATSECI